MNDVITIPSRSGSMVVDFIQKRIILNREGALAQTAGLSNMSIDFADITDIELREPSFTMLGACNIIIKRIRYITTANFDMTNFSVAKQDFELLKNKLTRVLIECNIPGFRAVNSVVAERVIFTATNTNFTMSYNAQGAFNQKKEEFSGNNGYMDIITEAKLFAQSVELQLLKAPATARFCSLEEMAVTEQNGIFTVSGYVDSQNSYAAMIRTPFTLRVYKDSTGWKSADQFQSTQASIHETVAKNMAIYWILGIIGAAVSFVIMYAIVSSTLGF